MIEAVGVLLFAGVLLSVKGGLYRRWSERDAGKPSGFRDPQDWAQTQFLVAYGLFGLAVAGIVLWAAIELL